MRPSCRRPILSVRLSALLLAGLTSLPAPALTIHGGKTLREDMQAGFESSAQALNRREVVGLAILKETKGAGPGQMPQVDGSGVFLGTDGTGRTGFILSAAHLFCHGDKPTEQEKAQTVHLYFSRQRVPGEGDETPISIPATRVLIHPRYLVRVAPESKESKKGEVRAPLRLNDLAILEFDAAQHSKALEEAEATPAVLYDGSGYSSKPLLDAQIVGFGRFATHSGSTSLYFHHPRAHSGHTKVTYGLLEDRNTFFHWSMLNTEWLKSIAEALKVLGSEAPQGNRQPFLLQLEPRQAIWLKDGTKVSFQSHMNQALLDEGDLGGPMFFKSGGSFKVAGIASSVSQEQLQDGSEVIPTVLQCWEPLMDKLDWIRAVREGTDSQSTVIKLMKQAGLPL